MLKGAGILVRNACDCDELDAGSYSTTGLQSPSLLPGQASASPSASAAVAGVERLSVCEQAVRSGWFAEQRSHALIDSGTVAGNNRLAIGRTGDL